MPFVRAELKKGKTFLVIYQSKPIAKLSPVDDLEDLQEASDEEVEMLAMQNFGDDEDDLSEEELGYYMSLKSK